MSSNNESLNNESLSKVTYFNAQLQQQQHQQQFQYQFHQQQQQQLLNYQQSNYSSGNYGQINSIPQHQTYQHQPLSHVFPSIYSDTNFNLKNMATNQTGMTSSSGASSTTSVLAASSSSTNHYSSVQRQIQQDWSNREYIEIIVSNIKKLTDFLNSFELSCRSKMAILDEKLTKIERSIEFVEARVTKGETLN